MHSQWFLLLRNRLNTRVVHLIYCEGIGVAELTELGLGAQEFCLDFWIHVGQQFMKVVLRGQGELWQRQLQQTGCMRGGGGGGVKSILFRLHRQIYKKLEMYLTSSLLNNPL